MNKEFCYQEKKKDVGGWRMEDERDVFTRE
jgi:hypothetical protein